MPILLFEGKQPLAKLFPAIFVPLHYSLTHDLFRFSVEHEAHLHKALLFLIIKSVVLPFLLVFVVFSLLAYPSSEALRCEASERRVPRARFSVNDLQGTYQIRLKLLRNDTIAMLLLVLEKFSETRFPHVRRLLVVALNLPKIRLRSGLPDKADGIQALLA